MDEPWKHDAQWKKSDTKDHIPCDSIYIKRTELGQFFSMQDSVQGWMTLKRPKVASPSMWQPSPSSPPTTLLQATPWVALARLESPLWEMEMGKAGMSRSQTLLHRPHGPKQLCSKSSGFLLSQVQVQKPPESQKLPHNSRKGRNAHLKQRNDLPPPLGQCAMRGQCWLSRNSLPKGTMGWIH